MFLEGEKAGNRSGRAKLSATILSSRAEYRLGKEFEDMKRVLGLSAAVLLVSVAFAPRATSGPPDKSWSIKADYIEACSCNLFCQCYFSTKPEGGTMCEFN